MTFPNLPNNVGVSTLIGRMTQAQLITACSTPAGIASLIQLLASGPVVDITTPVVTAAASVVGMTKTLTPVTPAPLAAPVSPVAPVAPVPPNAV